MSEGPPTDRGRRLRSPFGFAVFLLALAGCSGSGPGDSAPLFLADRVEDAELRFDRDRFRSFFKDAPLSDAFNLSRETRPSIVGFLPSSLEFPLVVPPEAVLRFAMGVATVGEVRRTPPVRFRVRVDTGERSDILFEETVGRRNQWIDREIELDSWASESVRLVFTTSWGRPPAESDIEGRILPLWGAPVLRSVRSSAERPLLVLISIDCLRADHVGAYGYDRPTTPNIDRLSEQAVVFEEAVSTSSWTLPAHMSMLTGLAPSQHGVETLERKLDPKMVFLPELLHDQGYETLGIVTWWFVSQAYGFDKGFDLFRASILSSADDVVDDAIALVRSGGGNRQFLFLHLLEPHWPYEPPEELLEKFGGRPSDTSRLLEMVAEGGAPAQPSDIEEVQSLYDAEIADADRALGRFFDELKSLGLYDSALIVVTADHGEAFYEHDSWQHGTLYEEVLRVPLIVKFPDGEPARVTSPVSLTNIFSTFVQQAGAKRPEASPPSLWEVAFGPSLSPPSRLVSEYRVTSDDRHGAWPPPGTSRMVSFRRDGLKYIATLTDEQGAAETHALEEELYDLRRDPGEREDLLLERLQQAQSFRARLRTHLSEMARLETARNTPAIALDEGTKRLLESLGYTTR